MRVTVKSIVNVDVHVDQWSCGVRMQKVSVIRRAAVEITLIRRDAVLPLRPRVPLLDVLGRLAHEKRRHTPCLGTAGGPELDGTQAAAVKNSQLKPLWGPEMNRVYSHLDEVRFGSLFPV